MNRQDRVLAAYEAAVMHFVQGETMESIARRLCVSRSTVSRLIAEAKDTGLVQITIHQPQEVANEMQYRISQMFNVQVKVVPVPSASMRRGA